MLKTRVITAVVLLAVLLPVTLFAPLAAFGALIALALVFAAWEWGRLLKLGGAGPLGYAAVAALALGASTRL
ncbi:phosphatidate cytidylyltransferase, partial [Burkholderia pseudomallei]